MAAPKGFAPLRVHVDKAGGDPRVVFSGGPRGTHSIGVTVSDDARIRAHAEGYAWAACLGGAQAESDFADEAVRVAGLWREQRAARLERQARERAAREGQVAMMDGLTLAPPAPSSQLQRTVERALRIALKHRVSVSAPGARRCHRCGRTGHDRRTCRAPELLVNAWALRRAALYERSARRDRERADREQRSIRDPRRLDPMAQPNTCSPRERTHLGCRCPGHDGTAVDVAAIADWIHEGCVLHDTARGDARAAARAWDGLGVCDAKGAA